MNTLQPSITPAASLLTPDDTVLLLLDHQPQMFFGAASGDRAEIINATVALAKAARLFEVPTILSTIVAAAFTGPLLPQVADACPNAAVIDRTTLNAWEDGRVIDAIQATGRSKLVIAGLWTEACVAMPALSALEQGYEVFVATDACAGVTAEAHRRAIDRMVARGAVPIGWMTFMLELQRDWARGETYPGVIEIAGEHGGAYGVGLFYAHAMLTPESAAA
jgi:nicotinamidase-related amidase